MAHTFVVCVLKYPCQACVELIGNRRREKKIVEKEKSENRKQQQ